MAGDKKDNFAYGDLIVSKLLSDKKKAQLEVGDVITFWTVIEGKRDLNTHRILSIETGAQVAYITKGDANIDEDPLRVLNSEVVGKYQFKMKGTGKALLFFQSSTGFLIFVVIPSALALAYCVFLFVRNLRGFTKLKKEEEKEKMKAALLQEINEKERAAKDTQEG